MLSSKELVHVNATIIAGVLIFITLALTSFSDRSTSSYRFIITLFTVTVLIPFAISATSALDGKDMRATGLLKAGLLYTVAVAITFAILSFFDNVSEILD